MGDDTHPPLEVTTGRVYPDTRLYSSPREVIGTNSCKPNGNAHWGLDNVQTDSRP
jgi:hypothetical protein